MAGCLAQRYADEIFKEMPEVDAIVGTGSYEAIVEVLDELFAKEDQTVKRVDPLEQRDLSYHKRVVSTPGYYEYLKIAEGCDNRCTYCIIPMLRGPYRSRRAEDILREAADLAAEGVKELMIVAQDITKYGRDLEQGDYALPQLLTDLCRIDGLEWIRLLYCYPEDVTDELIAVMKAEPKILPYIDMPIQHSCDSVLKRMGRRHTRKELEQLIQKLRAEIPEIAIRTTLITGFPGETEEEFEDLVAFVNEARLDRLGVFPYSQEEGTAAARMSNQIPEEVKEARKATLMELQQGISEELSAAWVGREVTAMIEGRIPGEGEEDYEVYSARTYRDAPEIDGLIFVTSDQELRSGDLVRCRVTGAYEYDLIGELL